MDNLPVPPKRTQEEIRNMDWLKNNINTLLTSEKFCVLCLSNHGAGYTLDMQFTISKKIETMTLRQLVDRLFNIQIEDVMPGDHICEKCTEKVINSFIFIEDTKKMFKVLTHCINDLHSKVTDINNELDDNTDYKNSNVVIVVEYDKEIYKIVDELTSEKTAIITDNKHPAKIETKSIKLSPSIVASKVDNKNQKGPSIVPTLRNVRKDSKKLVISKDELKPDIKQIPNMTLKEGKLLIEPLITTSTITPKYNIYACGSCPSIFTTYRTLKEHEKITHNSITFQCRYCKKVYNSQQYLDIHYTNDHAKVRCKFCHDLFDDGHLNGHLKEKHKNHVNSCQFCDLVYYTHEQLETHIKSSHITANVHNTNTKQCIMCLRNMNEKELLRHKCRFSCSDCFKMPCIHFNYLMYYREQVLNHSHNISCIDCDYVTKRKEYLISHVNREHLDYHPFTCGDCGTQFYTKLSLKTHIAQFHRDLKCQYCDYEFSNNKSYEQHITICKQVTRLNACDKCVASFDTTDELDQHKTKYHSSIFFPCAMCKKEFVNEMALEEHHARVHSGIQYKKRRSIIECTICDITLKNLKEMTEHEQLHDSSQLFPCKECPKSFKSLRKVYLHKQRHYSQRIKCDKCHKLVASSYMSQHKALCSFRNINNKIQVSHTCKVCGKSFSMESSLKIHKTRHAQTEPCIYCNRKIKVWLMKRHIEMRHTKKADEIKNPTIHQCLTCIYTTRKKSDLENHTNRIHLKIRPYTCTICNKSFYSKLRLMEHEKTHAVDKVCYCPHCGKKFANKVCLKMHIRRHTGENPYECKICFQKFRSSSIMKTHRLKKHQDKTISCPLCDTMYHLLPEMRYHVKKVHWKSDDPFDYTKIVPQKFHHLFVDRRLQKIEDECVSNEF